MKEGLKSMFTDIFQGWMKVILDAILLDGKGSENIISVIKEITEATGELMIPIASVFVCIYFLMDLMDKLTSERFNAEVLIKMLMKLLAAVAIVSNASEWAIKIMTFGADFSLAVIGQIGNDVSFNLGQFVDDLGFWQSIGMYGLMLFPWIVSSILKIALYMICYGRTIEMGVRSAFAPIGCADLMTGGANSNGMRYLKGLFAIALQGAIMIGVVFVGSKIIELTIMNTKGLTNVVAFIPKYLGIVSAMVGMMGASKGIAKEVIG